MQFGENAQVLPSLLGTRFFLVRTFPGGTHTTTNHDTIQHYHKPRFLQIRLRHESRDKYVIHISKTAFQKKNAILKRRIIM